MDMAAAMLDSFSRMGWWDWLGVSGFVVAVMAIPTILQMWFGRARLLAEFRVEHHNADRSLQIFLSNPPLKEGSLLDRLGVERNDIKSLSVNFRVTIAGGTDLIPIHHLPLCTDDHPEQINWRISLPPTYFVPASTILVSWDNAKKVAIVPPDRLRDAKVVPQGHYVAHIVFSVNGRNRIVTRSFIVGVGADDLKWVVPKDALNRSDQVFVL